MKRLSLFLVLIIGGFGLSHAQNNFLDKLQKFAETADTIGYLRDSFYVVEGSGMLALNDGTETPGIIELHITKKPAKMNYIMFTPEGQMRSKRIKEKKVNYFVVNGHVFYPMKLKRDDIGIGHTRIFVEMLNENSDDPFKMYLLRLVSEKPAGFRQEGNYELSRSYYAFLPGFKIARGLEDLTFTPFARKMSNYLKDCSELSKKIKNKEKGYKYSMFKGAENIDVFFRIMEEYNHCDRKKDE